MPCIQDGGHNRTDYREQRTDADVRPRVDRIA